MIPRNIVHPPSRYATGRPLLLVALLVAATWAGCLAQSHESGAQVLAYLGEHEQPGPFFGKPAVYDLDGDGEAEIIAHSTDRQVYVFGTGGQGLLTRFKTTHPPAWYVQQVSNSVAVLDDHPSGKPVIIVANHAAYVSAWTVTSTDSGWTATRLWEIRMTACDPSPSMDAGAALGDLDGDGRKDIAVQTEEVGLFALTADGTPLWHHCWSGGNSDPIIDDLDGDGNNEVIFASDAGFVAVLRGTDGNPLWTFDAGDPRYGVKPASITVAPTVADLDGVPPKEILFTTRNAPYADPARYNDSHMAIWAVNHHPETWKAQLVWKVEPGWANPLSSTHLVVRDVDGDGFGDVFGMDWNTIGHRPGDWERLGPANAFRLDHQGQTVWHREVDAWWSDKDVTLIGEGASAVLLANGPGTEGDGLTRLQASDGAALGHIAFPGWKMTQGAVHVASADGGILLAIPVQSEHDPGRAAIALLHIDDPTAV